MVTFQKKGFCRRPRKSWAHKKIQWRKPSDPSSPVQWISNEWNREPGTSDCRKQCIVPAVSQSNETWARNLLQKGQIGIYIRKRDTQVKEKHRWIWRNQGEKMMDKQCYWRKGHQARLRHVQDTSSWALVMS